MAGKGTDDDLIRAVRDPDDLLILQAGGSGLYSMVMTSWCAGPHANRAVSQEIMFGQACEIPGMRL